MQFLVQLVSQRHFETSCTNHCQCNLPCNGIFKHCSVPGGEGEGVLPYKALMGTCRQPGYVFRDFCLEQGIEFIIFCLNQGIDLSILVLNWVKCLKQGIKKSELCLKMGRKISDICLKQGQGMRGRAAPPQPGIHRVPPPPPRAQCNICPATCVATVCGTDQ